MKTNTLQALFPQACYDETSASHLKNWKLKNCTHHISPSRWELVWRKPSRPWRRSRRIWAPTCDPSPAPNRTWSTRRRRWRVSWTTWTHASTRASDRGPSWGIESPKWMWVMEILMKTGYWSTIYIYCVYIYISNTATTVIQIFTVYIYIKRKLASTTLKVKQQNVMFSS